jgi:hypothetical protein
MKKLLTIALILVFFPFANAQNREHDVKPKPKTQKTRTITNTGEGVSIDLTSIFRSLKKNKNCNQLEMVFPETVLSLNLILIIRLYLDGNLKNQNL